MDPEELNSLNFLYLGQPYNGNTDSDVDVNTLDFLYLGQPFAVTQAASDSPVTSVQVIIIT